MTNIFNKVVLSKNGTLEKNWLEERALRDILGEGRSLPGKHIPKRTMDFDNETKFECKRDDTKTRILGTALESEVKSSYSSYGTFNNDHKKYQRMGVKDKIFQDFFNNNVLQSQKEKEEKEEMKNSVRLLDTTKNNEMLPQNVDYSGLGKRIMKTQDCIQVQGENVDKLFMANHDMSKYPNIISSNTANQYIDKLIPYYKDKEITFWSMNLEKSNMYRSHTLGNNAFAKSSGFTQTVHNAKSAKQYYGNINNNPDAKFVYTNETDEKFINNYKEHTSLKTKNLDLMPTIKEKILSVCKKNGWIGLRKLRTFFRNLKGRKSDKIKRVDLKYFLIEFGIFLSDSEISYIYQVFDENRKDEINYMTLFDNLIEVSEQRLNIINQFALQVVKENNLICFKSVEKLLSFDFHPEVITFKKTANDVHQEFIVFWDNLKENNLVTTDNFIKFFKEISFCVDNDDEFIQILRCW